MTRDEGGLVPRGAGLPEEGEEAIQPYLIRRASSRSFLGLLLADPDVAWVDVEIPDDQIDAAFAAEGAEHDG